MTINYFNQFLDRRITLPVLYLLICFWSADCSFGQYRYATLDGEHKGDYFGQALAAIDDLDGDGRRDLLVGAPCWSANGLVDTGCVYALSGQTGDLLWTFEGDEEDLQVGWAVAGMGDANNDGIPDVAVGGPFEWMINSPGRAWILSGADGSILQTYHGENNEDEFGSVVGSAGDFDNDGYADIAIGAYGYDGGISGGTGKAYVYSGWNGRLISSWPGDADFDNFGCDLTAIGDWDGDGRDELAIGSKGSDQGISGQAVGKVVIMSSSTHQPLLTLWGDEAGDFFGYSVAAAGDVNDDGQPDLLVGATGGDYARVHLGPGGQPWHVFHPENPTTYFYREGFAGEVRCAGDVNGDGYPDLAVGAYKWGPVEDDYHGRLYVFSGDTGDLLYRINGTEADEMFGSRIAGPLDGALDGYSDVAVAGCYFDGPAGNRSGHVILVAGSPGRFVAYGSGNIEQRGQGLPTADGFAVQACVENGPAGCPGLIGLGRVQENIPIQGAGTLYAWPWIIMIPIVTDNNGGAEFNKLIPPLSAHPTALFYSQVWLQDQHGTFYYSNGLTWEVAVP